MRISYFPPSSPKSSSVLKLNSQASRLRLDPLCRVDISLFLGPVRYARTPQLFHDALIFRPHEIDDAVPRILPLCARGGDDAMTARAEYAIGELDGCVTEIDNFG